MNLNTRIRDFKAFLSHKEEAFPDAGGSVSNLFLLKPSIGFYEKQSVTNLLDIRLKEGRVAALTHDTLWSMSTASQSRDQL
jgi:hypothetical protein